MKIRNLVIPLTVRCAIFVSQVDVDALESCPANSSQVGTRIAPDGSPEVECRCVTGFRNVGDECKPIDTGAETVPNFARDPSAERLSGARLWVVSVSPN